ncbi:MAG: NADH:ubiquinone oxidoreductase subunit NDUFA12 [Pseudomonadota bacterium]
MGFFSEIFSWWGGNTWGMRLYTARQGKLIGSDEAGNRYYEQARGVGPIDKPRRWVIYKNGAEASQIPPGWYGWMHHTTDEPPTQAAYTARPWQKPHQANQTGTPNAYRPQGSILTPESRPKATGDYQAWTPD